jgi:hypothetical protein
MAPVDNAKGHTIGKLRLDIAERLPRLMDSPKMVIATMINQDSNSQMNQGVCGGRGGAATLLNLC